MSYLEIKDLSFKYQVTPIFESAEMRLFEGEHMVLLGENGSGKTTLLKLLIKELTPDKGTVSWAGRLELGYLDQYASLNQEQTVFSYLVEVYDDLFKEEARMIKLYEDIANQNSTNIEKDLDIAQSIQDHLLNSDFYRIKSSLSNIINGLGMEMDILNKPIKILSSGMREKIILGKCLLKESDCLILDEPTNFLDVAHIEWLTKFLKSYDKTFIVVSHDEKFVSEICNVVIAIENKKLVRYKGDYDFYLKNRALQLKQHHKNYEAQQRDIKQKERFIQKNLVRASTTKQAQSVRKKLAKMAVIEKPTKPKKLTFSFPYAPFASKEVLKVNDLIIGYTKPLLKVNLTLYKENVIVITGYNGIGKSTFIKTILYLIDALDGDFIWNDNVIINYFHQELDLEETLTPFEHLYYAMDVDDQKSIYALLSRYGLTYEQSRRPLSQLSGGQQTKTRLAIMNQIKSNCLILDEPTNHLDIHAKKTLKEAIQTYKGAVILITHNQEFYQDLNARVIDFEKL